MRVGELMTRDVVSIEPTATVAECLAAMRSQNFHMLPVVSAGRALGILTEHRAAAADPAAQVVDVMADVVVTARPLEPVYDVLNRCSWAMTDFALVVENEALVGLLTEYDAVKHAAKVLSEDLSVEDHATTTLVCIEASRPATEALDRMHRSFLRDLVVLVDRKLLGILGERECLAARLDEHPERTAGELVPDSQNARRYVYWDTPLKHAADTMVRDHLGCLPVVSDDGQLRVEAVVSRADVVRALLASGEVGETGLSIDNPTL